MTFAIQGALPWFGWSKGKAERNIFEEKGYCAVYVAGEDKSLRLGWTSKDPGWSGNQSGLSLGVPANS